MIPYLFPSPQRVLLESLGPFQMIAIISEISKVRFEYSRRAQDSSDLYFSQKDVDEREAPKEEVEEELETTSYDFVAEKKDHKSRHHAEDVVDSASSKKSTAKEDIETPSSPSSTKEYATAMSKKQKAVAAAQKAKKSRI